MNRPVQQIPGQQGMISVRCSYRELKLVPTKKCVKIFLYQLAIVAKRYGMLIHEFIVMSNHFHIVLTDPEAALPDFWRDLNSGVARALNSTTGDRENVFSTERPNFVRCVGDEVEVGASIADRCVYTLVNPVAAGLVRKAKQWPGATSWAMEYGRAVVVKRPELKFYGKKRPPQVELVLTRPPGFDASMSDAEVRAAIRTRVKEEEAKILAEHRKKGKPFVGAAAVRAQSRLQRPATPHGKEIDEVTPTIAARSKWAAIAAKQQVKAFTKRYREALKRWKAGERDVVFPYGTWRMARYFGVLVENAWGSGVPRPPSPSPGDSAAAA